MAGGFVPRVALEAGFLILVGVGAGLASLRTVVIVGLLAGSWLLVTMIELTVWYGQSRVQRSATLPAPGGPVEPTSIDPGPFGGDAYPLRPDAGSMPSAEVEAYTRVLDLDDEQGSPPERSE